MSAETKEGKVITTRKIVCQELDVLLRTRFRGAANIRGIRYQILYSILRAFDLYVEGNEITSIRLEGIEDVDLLGLHFGDEYIQVKSSKDSWNWARLRDPIKSFLQVHRADSNCRFVLVVNFQLRKDIAELAQIDSLSPRERKRVKSKFRKLCREVGASSDEADSIMNKLSIISAPEKQILERLRAAVADAFRLASEAVNIYISVFVARFLDWAEGRKTVTRTDLDKVRVSVGENLARESEFQAYGRCLIDKISWKSDANIADFFEGKGTRPGHIVADVDVRRPAWIEKIDKALNSSKICILRSSSGQGKSALLFRYAYEHWPPQNTYILRTAKSSKDVELVSSYLRFRADLGLPVLLLIDNTGWRTRLWPFIANECAALGIRVLVTIRSEDWHRFARESLTGYEILEPVLNLDEVRQIFRVFQSERRLHASVDSPEWAYERIGEPHLLMEYVYLLTHGQMLEERLRDQMKQFSEHREDPAKVEILRRTALADALGAPILADKLLQGIQLRDDPQQVLNSLSDEYIKLEDGVITGLHWVRSDHLAHILHEGYPNPGNTALTVLDAIPSDRISLFVSNALSWQGLAFDTFIKGLIEKSKNVSLDTILAFLDGLFEAGEKQFFEASKSLFDEAYKLVGVSGPFLLCTDFTPTTKLNTINEMANIFEDERGENYRKLKEIASRVTKQARGLDLVCEFLSEISQYISPEKLQASHDCIGCLLDWCFLCNVSLPSWSATRDDLLTCKGIFNLPLKKFCDFAQGLYRYDVLAYHDWFLQEQENILGYLKLHTDCIELKVLDEALYVEFFTELENINGVHEQAVSRLKKLHSAIPFCRRYKSQGIWSLPFGLTPSMDETHKNIPNEKLLFESDVEKNVIWRNVTGNPYLPDSYFEYEKLWYNFRQDALFFVKDFSKYLQRALTGRRFSSQSVYELFMRLARSSKHIPSLSVEDLEAIGKPLSQPLKEILKKRGPNKWHDSFKNFLFQIFQYAQDHNMDIGRLAVTNFLEAVKCLPEMHEAFAQLFENAPDYFHAGEINGSEIRAYHKLADLLDVWILDPPRTPQRNISRYVKIKKEQKKKEIIQRVHKALAPLEKKGITVNLPSDIYVSHPLRYFPLVFSVNNPCYHEEAFEMIIGAIAEVRDVADFFCLVPIYQGARFFEGGYLVSSEQTVELKEGRLEQWKTVVPELPKGALDCLPPLSHQPSTRLQIQTNVLELLSQLQYYLEQKYKIEGLRKSANHFEIELYNRHNSRLHELEINLGTVASKTKNLLKTEFLSLQNSPAYRTLQYFLKMMEEASRQGNIDELPVSEDFDMEGIIGSLNQLLQ